ncbi:hypothetical protein [Salmonirosea aquatica]|uniref:hypothetical protein n=1 Tax=Salmonirosea aquatica TaxID=2654236 RepID=UPI00357163C3
MKTLFSLLLLFFLSLNGFAQTSLEVVYKRVDSTVLNLVLDYPPGYQSGQSYPTLVFFFGGGWVNGSIAQFEPHARYFASRGMICARADYRVKNRQGTPLLRRLKMPSRPYGTCGSTLPCWGLIRTG